MKSRLLFGLLLAAPGLANAVGLGDIHLGSALNQPLSADIDLLGATTEELTQLRAGVASRDIFTRYGIDHPAFLTGFTFKVTKDAAGHNVLSVRSSDAISEPFVTFLVELSWPRGHLIREYTVLLDPPVFEKQPSVAVPMAAPVTGTSSAAASGAVERAAPASSAASAPAAAVRSPSSPAAGAAARAGDYAVAANDSLSAIVRREGGVSAPADVNRLMIATFRANPAAFDGNINRLRRGAVLRLPPQSEWSAMDEHEAVAEVRRQVEAWRTTLGGSGRSSGGARLRLVVPTDTGATADAATKTSAPASGKTAALEKELADARRLLELKNAEFARLQAQSAQAQAQAQVQVQAQAKAKAEAEAEAEAKAKAQVQAAPAAAPSPPAQAPTKSNAPAVPAVPAAPGFFEGASDNLLYGGIAALVALIGGLIGLNAWRRRRTDAEFDDSMQPTWAEPAPEVTTQSLSTTEMGTRAPDDIVVEESAEDASGEFVAPPFAPSETASIARSTLRDSAPVADLPAMDAGIGLDQTDSLAEADFHMAYGLYDQAADIVKQAIEREPARRDLQLKLLEVFFVWGNKDAFIDVARTLARGRDAAPAGEWDKVAIMGRQIAPDDALFAGQSQSSSHVDIDFDLDAAGTQGIDLDLLGDSSLNLNTGMMAQGGVDLDLGHALAGSDAASDTGNSPTLDPDRFDLLLEPEHAHDSGATTRELAARADASTVEQPALRSSAFEESPTVETPVYDLEDDAALLDRLDLALQQGSTRAPETTAEISIEDLGFDVESLDETDHQTLYPADGATLVAGLDSQSRSLLAAADADRTREMEYAPPADFESSYAVTPPTPQADEAANAATMLSPRLVDSAATELLPVYDPDAVGETSEIELSSSDLDLDLDELARALENDTVAQPRRDEIRFSTDVFATGIHKVPGSGMDLDVGAPLIENREPTVTERMPHDLDLPELEPVTLSEVGTKLDLARAYMDMGDPDGARSILQEVLSEGSSSQKVEAQRLIETLPH